MTEAVPRAGRRSRARTAAIVTAALLAGLVLLLAGAWWAVFARPATDVAAGAPVQLEIPSGASTAQIGEILANAGVVDNANRFRLQSRLRDADGSLRAGIYDLETGMGYDSAIDQLLDGPPIAYVTVTFPEGFTIEQMAARLEEKAGIPAREFSDLAKTGAAKFARPYLERAYKGSLEGYLFPKTYRIKEGSSAQEVIELMLDQFEQETAGLDMARARSLGMDLHDVVTIASMIEREASVAKERPLVSSVIYNRLGRGMRLEIDATIEYVLPGNRFRLLNRHLRIDSPYNTYRNDGLPPGPIASPGLASLEAATQPADTDYIYYVLTGKDGSHTFARNAEEFAAAKRKSKEVFGR